MRKISSLTATFCAVLCLISVALAEAADDADREKTQPALVKLVAPIYPQLARIARVTGDVNIEIKVLPDGSLSSAGVGMFYITYVLFEIPGAVIVERWSARKWIARIMISWGIVTILTGFVHTTTQFYVARFFLGAAESSFFPGMIVYLTHWFCVRDRSRAIACLYAANPAAALIGSPLAGWLLGVHWQSLAGWRWLFILEGIPAVIVGIITWFYLTDRPHQAGWL